MKRQRHTCIRTDVMDVPNLGSGSQVTGPDVAVRAFYVDGMLERVELGVPPGPGDVSDPYRTIQGFCKVSSHKQLLLLIEALRSIDPREEP